MPLTEMLPDAGLPPSWARRRTAEEHIEHFGDMTCAVLWRRKLLLPDPTSRRPAYFGSWRKARSANKHMRTCRSEIYCPSALYYIMWAR